MFNINVVVIVVVDNNLLKMFIVVVDIAFGVVDVVVNVVN